MDIDEFLDREISSLSLQTDKAEKQEPIELPQFKEELKEGFELSPLFENIKANLSKGNLEQAEESYTRLWNILVQQKLNWNKELYEHLSILSRQFSAVLGNAHNEVKRKAEHIYELISRARAALKEGKKDMPFKLYSEIGEVSNSIPNVFFEEKKVIGQQISDFYKELRNATDSELAARVSSLVREISQLMDRISLSIRANDMPNSIVSYSRCIELYSQIPEGFLRHKNPVGMRLLEIYKSLSIYSEISSLQKQLSQQAQFQQTFAFAQPSQQMSAPAKSALLSEKRERAKRSIEKGFYNEALMDIEEALRLEPNDAEARAIHAKIKTLQ